ncbi:hypothetical protein [Mycobacterium sp. CnD-18-1]|uniref:hypothetical protein n=1 Tax=Mycobacterium sp. CnD-18-1 TaxID=2917744 RepID=UPI001EF398F9|nr:hypothetical protein [Mycobacterium sp. CnD-18-1]MCG7610377.1 hypothetical protein [Mycobacterium sp. CnD-18-1]
MNDTRLTQALDLLTDAHKLIEEVRGELGVGARIGGVMVGGIIDAAAYQVDMAAQNTKRLVNL